MINILVMHYILISLAILNVLYSTWVHTKRTVFTLEEWRLTANIYSWLFTIALVALSVTLHLGV